jgi:hypothetical protein
MNTVEMVNNTAMEIARVFWFRADAHYEDAQKKESTTSDRVASYNLAGHNYNEACEWFSKARGMTIGHNRRNRYEEAADNMKEKSELAYACARTLKV